MFVSYFRRSDSSSNRLVLAADAKLQINWWVRARTRSSKKTLSRFCWYDPLRATYKGPCGKRTTQSEKKIKKNSRSSSDKVNNEWNKLNTESWKCDGLGQKIVYYSKITIHPLGVSFISSTDHSNHLVVFPVNAQRLTDKQVNKLYASSAQGIYFMHFKEIQAMNKNNKYEFDYHAFSRKWGRYFWSPLLA